MVCSNLATYNSERIKLIYDLSKKVIDAVLSTGDTDYLADIKDLKTLSEFDNTVNNLIENRIKEYISVSLIKE